MTYNILQPESWPRPKGYANGIVAQGRLVFVAGQVGWNEKEEIVRGLVPQVEQALRNVVEVLNMAGIGPEAICRMTWYLTDMEDYLGSAAEIGAAYRRVMGRNFAAMTAVEVRRLAEPDALVEIEVTAVVPDRDFPTP